ARLLRCAQAACVQTTPYRRGTAGRSARTPSVRHAPRARAPSGCRSTAGSRRRWRRWPQAPTSEAGFYQIGALFGDSNDRGVDIAGGYGRHNRGIDHPEVLDALHAQMFVDHRSDAARGYRVEHRVAGLAAEREPVRIALHLRTGQELVDDVIG